MKNVLIRILTFSLFAGVALAQNSDLGLLLGTNGPISGTVGNSHVSSSFAAGFQINYAAQLHETVAGQLYLELPLMFAASVSANVGTNVNANVGDSIFFTPGLRWRFTPQKRVSFYASLGGGIGTFGNTVTVVAGGPSSYASVNIGRKTSAALGFGGGIDFRLTRLLSLRAEGRDFVTGDQLGGTSGRHHAFFMAGIGFHF